MNFVPMRTSFNSFIKIGNIGSTGDVHITWLWLPPCFTFASEEAIVLDFDQFFWKNKNSIDRYLIIIEACSRWRLKVTFFFPVKLISNILYSVCPPSLGTSTILDINQILNYANGRMKYWRYIKLCLYSKEQFFPLSP